MCLNCKCYRYINNTLYFFIKYKAYKSIIKYCTLYFHFLIPFFLIDITSNILLGFGFMSIFFSHSIVLSSFSPFFISQLSLFIKSLDSSTMLLFGQKLVDSKTDGGEALINIFYDVFEKDLLDMLDLSDQTKKILEGK